MAEQAADNTGLASEKEARDVAEAARESEWSGPSFVRELFLGRFNLDLIHPHPVVSDPAEQARADAFLAKLRAFLERADSDMIDRTGDIPEAYVQELREMGAFGIKIPLEYGGVGLSYANYTRAIAMVTSKDGSLAALLSAHQSIGLPQPLKLFGTAEQKQRYFPRLAKGAISAFALTEVDAGSDPANLRTSATPSEDGKSWTISGEKLWCTNGTRAELLVVMARTPDAVVNGKPRKQITAFIVEANAPGVEVVHRCRFMGLKAIENGVIRFTNVRVSSENILWGVGKGLKLALITLNTDAARRARMGERACAVGTADRQARGDRSEARADGGEHLCDGVGCRAHRRAGGAREVRHQARSGHREDVEHGDGMADRRRHAADPRRPRLRDRGFAARSR